MIEELEHRLDFLVAERKRLSGIAKMNLNGEFTRHGAFASSGRMLAQETLAQEQLDEAILDLVNDVEKAKQNGVAEADLRAALTRAITKIIQVLRDIFIEQPNPAFGGPSYGARPQALDDLEKRAGSLVQQYWAGYLARSTPHGTVISLSVNNSPGAAIQQGGAGNAQTMTNTTINIPAAQVAAAGLEAALAALPASQARADAEADLSSLQRHLTRQEPQPGLIKEMGKALRTGVGKLFSGFASEAGHEAADALWTALDL